MINITWNKIFKYYGDSPKLEKVKKKIYFFLTSFFIPYYCFFLLDGNYANQFDFYLILFSLVFNVVTLLSVIYFKTSKIAVIVSSFNDITNTTLAVWFTGGPYSIDLLWYFTLILGLIVLVETRMGMITACIAFVNLIAIFYAEINHLVAFEKDAHAIDFNARMVNLLSVFIVLIIIVYFVTKKDLYEEEIIQEKDENINTLETELDKRMHEIAKLRANIARDFHDVMGNKLASIAAMSEMISLKNNYSEEYIRNEVQRINTLSKEVYFGTKDFIWSLDSNHNNLLEAYIHLKDFGEIFFNTSPISFESKTISLELESIGLNQRKISQLILIFKESFTNVLMHSKATWVKFSALIEENMVSFVIEDNGVGFDFEQLNRINGLNNMKNRAESSDFLLEIDSQPSKGTKILLVLCVA